ncbi:hypothetical protein F5Y14DRAFT_211484 [Nemania sp. NC0429]|nr:hypothetical protein F5Y14DRAFT_211484 [Nemania sp. NC0429]
MPAPQIEEVLATKPVTFNIKTSGGSWVCQIHPNRAAFERSKSVTSVSAPAPTPGIARTDSGLSTMSTASTSSSSSTSSH